MCSIKEQSAVCVSDANSHSLGVTNAAVGSPLCFTFQANCSPDVYNLSPPSLAFSLLSLSPFYCYITSDGIVASTGLLFVTGAHGECLVSPIIVTVSSAIHSQSVILRCRNSNQQAKICLYPTKTQRQGK